MLTTFGLSQATVWSDDRQKTLVEAELTSNVSLAADLHAQHNPG